MGDSMNKLVLSAFLVVLPASSFAAERLQIPPGCAVYEQIKPNSWVSFLHLQLKALRMNHALAVEFQKSAKGNGEVAFVETLTSWKSAIAGFNCSAYLMNRFEDSKDQDLASAAEVLRTAYTLYSLQQSTYLKGILSGQLAFNALKRADAESTLAVQTDDLSVALVNGMGYNLLKLVDIKRPNAANHLDRLVLTRAELDSLKQLVSDLFPEMSDPDPSKADADIYIRPVTLLKKEFGQHYKVADEP
jgi:hypothetical protein